jgi:hypothetical protein
VKHQLKTLLYYKNLYWRKRFTNNKVKFGHECTHFFHAMATISHRQNTISHILDEDGIWVQDHSGKEALLWSAFKNILGISTQVLMVYIRVKVQVDLQADKSPVVVKGPFFPRVVNPRYRICGTNA